MIEKGEPQSFNEFLDCAMRELHDGLLRGGAPEMRAKLHMWLTYYGRWNDEMKEEIARREKLAKVKRRGK